MTDSNDWQWQHLWSAEDNEYLRSLERAYEAHLNASQRARAVELRILAWFSPSNAQRDRPGNG